MGAFPNVPRAPLLPLPEPAMTEFLKGNNVRLLLRVLPEKIVDLLAAEVSCHKMWVTLSEPRFGLLRPLGR